MSAQLNLTRSNNAPANDARRFPRLSGEKNICGAGGKGILRLGSNSVLRGDGLIDATVENQGGIIQPGLSPGTLTISGNYIGGPNSQVIFGVTGNQSNQLNVQGTVQLDPASSIVVVVDPVNPPPPGATFTLLQDSSSTPLVQVVATGSGDVAVVTAPQIQSVPTTVATGGTVSKLIRIDLKPGSTANTVNLHGHGVLPVAILSSPTFNAGATIDPTTIRLAGASVRLAGRSGKSQCTHRDVNGDGVPDLVCDVEVDHLSLVAGETVAVLNAESVPQYPCDPMMAVSATNCARDHFTGDDRVRIVP